MPGFFELRKMDWEKLTSVSMRAESLGIDLDLNQNLCFKILVVAVIISDKTILNNSGLSYIYKVNSRFILFLVTTDKNKQFWLVQMEKKRKERKKKRKGFALFVRAISILNSQFSSANQPQQLIFPPPPITNYLCQNAIDTIRFDFSAHHFFFWEAKLLGINQLEFR